MSVPAVAAFISYSRIDTVFALRLATDLRAAGAPVWFDQLDIKAGEPWDDAIERALIAAHRMVLVMTPASVKSPNVRDEIAYALNHGKIVIPVMVEECEAPLRIGRTHWIDLRADYARGLKALVAELSGAQSVAAPPAASAPAVARPAVTAAAAAPRVPLPWPAERPPLTPAPARNEEHVYQQGEYAFRRERAMGYDEMARLLELGRGGWEMTGFEGEFMVLRRPLPPAAQPAWAYQRLNGVLQPARRQQMERNGWLFVATYSHLNHYFKKQQGAG